MSFGFGFDSLLRDNSIIGFYSIYTEVYWRTKVARFERDKQFALKLLLNPSLGHGTGIFDPWDDKGDAELFAEKQEAPCPRTRNTWVGRERVHSETPPPT